MALVANGVRMKYLYSLLIILLLSSCSSRPLSEQIVGSVLERVTNTDISYNGANCPNIRRSCSASGYEEWYQKDGKLACACNN